jgi:phosphoheptose isomerase
MTTAHDGLESALVETVAPRFPAAKYPDAASYFSAYIEQSVRAANSIAPSALERAEAILVDAYTSGRMVFACGNGGSAAISNHLQCDHLKGIRSATDIAPRVVSLNANVELVTAIANDLGYEQVFSYQLQSQSAPGDVLVAVSSSGRSENIIRALSWAGDHGLRTIALTGFDGGAARQLADVSLHVDAANYGIVEDLHQAVMHALAQCIRQSRMTTGTILKTVF